MEEQAAKIIVVGAGVAGLRAALNLAEMGYKILLVDEAPAAGGKLLQLEKQYPTDHCGLCRLRPSLNTEESAAGCLRQGLIHDRVTFLPWTKVTAVTGRPGRLTVTVESTPSGISPELCTACGLCEEVCPESSPDLFNAGLNQRKAVFPASPFAPFSPRLIDWSICTKCGRCREVCPTGAVDLDQGTETRDLAGIALVLAATGRSLYDPQKVDLYGGGRWPNVLTALAYERLISPLGPWGGLSESGLPLRPSDGREAKRIAWIQCVGSRNVMIQAPDCSNACCMFALKEAGLTREKSGLTAETAVFYMDLRTYGRDFQRYRDRAEQELGVRFVRSRVHSLDQGDDPQEVLVRYVDPEGQPNAESFDLVVLSTGQGPDSNNKLPEWARREGVLVADSSLALTDITDSLIAADALTARAAGLLKEQGHGGSVRKRPEIQLDPGRSGQILAVFLSPAEEDVSWEKVEKGLPADVRLVRLRSPFGPAAWEKIRRKLDEYSAGRLVVLAPGRWADQPASLMERALGLPGLFIESFDYAPLFRRLERPDQRAAVLLNQIKIKADLLRARNELTDPAHPLTASTQTAVVPSTLVVGGGPAGLSAALALADQDLDVTIVEKEAEIGHTAARLLSDELRDQVEVLTLAARNHPRISLRTGTKVVHCSGQAGDFRLKLIDDGGRTETLAAGAVILATGGGRSDTNAYGLGRHERIVSVFDLAPRLARPDFPADSLRETVFILCAGSREEPRNYCSRVCCPTALNTAIKIKTIRPAGRVTVFYRDVMTYGASERLYAEARRKGVLFIPFDLPARPQVRIEAGGPVVEGFDPLLQEPVRIEADWLALAIGVRPNDQTETAQTFGLDLTRDGFLKEADVKWRPVDSPREGIYVCGLGRAPARLNEAMREGLAAAGRAGRLLAGREIKVQRNIAFIKPGQCVRCLLCLPACPYQARSADDQGGPVRVDPAACRGCGLCVSVCPAEAIALGDYFEEGLTAALKTVLAGE